MCLSPTSSPIQAVLDDLLSSSAFVSFALTCHMPHLQISSLLTYSHLVSILTPASSSLAAVFVPLQDAELCLVFCNQLQLTCLQFLKLPVCSYSSWGSSKHAHGGSEDLVSLTPHLILPVRHIVAGSLCCIIFIKLM